MRGLAALVLLAAPAVAEVPRFDDMSARIPAHVYEGGWEFFVGGGVAALDCSANGLPDLVLAGGAGPTLLLRNQGGFAFVPELLDLTDVTGLYPLDIDGDGVLDLFVLRVGPNVVLRGLGACRFEDATAALGIDPGDAWSTAFTAWWDEGADRPTLFVGNYVDRDDPDGPFFACDDNQILTPEKGAGWRARRLSPGFCPLSALAARDARDRMSLRLSNDRHYYVRGGHEQMWDIADARFLGPEDGWPELMLWGMGIARHDITGNGLGDVYLTSMADQILQLAQEDGSYRTAPFEMGHTAHRPFTGDDGRPSTGWHAQWGDVTNNGRADLFVAKGNVDQMPDLAMVDPNNLLMQGPDGRFTEVAHLAGLADGARARGAALIDLDGDGRLDLVVVNRRAPARLYRNATEDMGNWLAVALRQPGANAFAMGARVAIKGTRQWQDVTVGGGHAGGQAGPLHFGLGRARAAQLEVTWPDGLQTSHDIATVNAAVTITRPE